MTYQIEFPNFDEKTMPAIPADFIDQSWHNDTCPSFFNAKLSMTLHIDYADKELCEFPDGERFTLTVIDDTYEVIFEKSSDDYDVILRAINAFDTLINQYIVR